jgi:isopenicillin N synthase-like dioxygenase
MSKQARQPNREMARAADDALAIKESPLNLPVVNLESPQAAEDLLNACKEFGAFYLVSDEAFSQGKLAEEALAAGKEFFELPDEVKKAYTQTQEDSTGYVHGMKDYMHKSNHEAFRLKASGYTHKAVSEADTPGFERRLSSFIYQALFAAEECNRLLDEALGGGTPLTDPSFTTGMKTCHMAKINHYFAAKSEPGRVAHLSHCDFGLWTILASDEEDGLQILDEEQREWSTVRAPQKVAGRGAVLVMGGEILQMYSNFTFKCAYHRVYNISGRERMSLAVFTTPPAEAMLSPLPGLIGPEDSPIIADSILAGDYLQSRYAAAFKAPKAPIS